MSDLAQLKQEYESLRLQLGVKKLSRMVAQYDAVEGSNNPEGGGNKRRQARVETKSEDELFPLRKRAQGINLQREAIRNYATHRGQIHQLRVNVVGPMGRVSVLTGDEWGKRAGDWFNQDWAENAEFRAGLHWGECLQLIVASLANEGDVVAAFDDGTITGGGGTGKIITWESDQITTIPETDFRARFPKNYTQDAGLIRDQFSREVGIIVSGARGQTMVEAGKAFILSRDPMTSRRDNWWTHIKRQYRLVQGRGVADSLTSIALAMDAYEILSKEMQSAKVNASLASLVKREEAVSNYDDHRFDPDAPTVFDDPDAEEVKLPEESKARNYDRLEALTGGNTEYVDSRDSIEFPNINRPNVNLPAFLDYVTDASAMPYGMAHAYARMKADTSYTAFRGDMVMTWVSFKDNQKFIERNAADWAAVNAIRWAIRTGKLPEGPAGWERRLAWQWPRMPEVDEKAYQLGLSAAIKNGAVTYQDVLGPSWKERFAQLGEELEEARKHNIPLAAFETKAGAVSPQTGENGNEENKD